MVVVVVGEGGGLKWKQAILCVCVFLWCVCVYVCFCGVCVREFYNNSYIEDAILSFAFFLFYFQAL